MRASSTADATDSIRGRLNAWLNERGGLAACGPAAVLPVVRADLERRRGAGEFDEQFAADLPAFRWPDEARRARLPMVLVVALPRPAHAVTVVHQGRRLTGLLPPTYLRYNPLFDEVRDDLAAHAFDGFTIELAEVPLKALAARLGLTRYGRNNLAYAPRLGSYLQLFGYLTNATLDLPAGWQPSEPRLLDECDGCDICELTCPTAAIGPDRVLLHGERCLTYANESLRPLPAWIPAAAHHCLVGCLRCQRPCPANPDLAVEDTGVVIDEAETAALAAGQVDRGAAAGSLSRKLGPLGLSFDVDLLGRNVAALIARPGGARRSG